LNGEVVLGKVGKEAGEEDDANPLLQFVFASGTKYCRCTGFYSIDTYKFTDCN
jgi:hypothetical protein